MDNDLWGGLSSSSWLFGQSPLSSLQQQQMSPSVKDDWLGQWSNILQEYALNCMSLTGVATNYGASIASFMFRRINELVGWKDGEAFGEPLDWLRVKVAKWLRKEA